MLLTDSGNGRIGALDARRSSSAYMVMQGDFRLSVEVQDMWFTLVICWPEDDGQKVKGTEICPPQASRGTSADLR